MVYPAETNHSLRARLKRERTNGTSATCSPKFSAFPFRVLSRSSSKHKTGNAYAYIGSSQFIIQENLSVFAVGNDCAEES
jgi:hypothetical protein